MTERVPNYYLDRERKVVKFSRDPDPLSVRPPDVEYLAQRNPVEPFNSCPGRKVVPLHRVRRSHGL